jgi:hypothetical protein
MLQQFKVPKLHENNQKFRLCNKKKVFNLPMLVYWPTDISKNTIGMPIMIENIRYGIRKAPLDKNFKNSYINAC